MGKHIREIWVSEGRGQSRRQRASGAYEYYAPTPLSARDLSLDADVSGDVARAEVAISRLNDDVSFLHDTEGVARLLLRAESVSSSHIEGLSIGARRLLRSEFALNSGGALRADAGAVAVIGNIRAMERALERATSLPELTTEAICDLHRTLCEGTPLEEWGGVVRDRQNWIGGSSYNPLDADFVPPAPEHVPALLDDLALFCNDTVTSPVEQAAVAHAQFENIHPFVDGNGRVGRALIQLIFRRRGMAPRFVPPVSFVLATRSRDYIDGVNGFAFDDAQGAEVARAKVNDWVSTFAGCCQVACEEARGFEGRMVALRASWAAKLGKVRAVCARRDSRRVPGNARVRYGLVVGAHGEGGKLHHRRGRPLRGGRCREAGGAWETQPRIRGPRRYPRVHPARTKAREPGWRHFRRAPRASGAPAPRRPSSLMGAAMPARLRERAYFAGLARFKRIPHRGLAG